MDRPTEKYELRAKTRILIRAHPFYPSLIRFSPNGRIARRETPPYRLYCIVWVHLGG